MKSRTTPYPARSARVTGTAATDCTVAHGAPVRLRLERQLGYKMAKYVMRIELRTTLEGLYGGKGGYWEDASGYQWYAGI